ncbi:MAG TPA: methyltransferase domain-containing protein [Blastocatellia bacterium]|nr:methyltransferase domain-containing protein [Blastocatellia bacterium]HMV82002.1 methyltransferase domain-containing protein [Blastocatellia bacterium]HMX30261.1 methyltransferase domain-containing protein [Blastocatellia bacterium]HMY74661.1 methyltransferase domain-containing protein [Blastocatellia bacterium]HMZ20421.1 methyltransferase domain-containing protein [Blastocatellia bacterium]
MKESLLPYLACPSCGGELTLRDAAREGREIISGQFICNGCPKQFPISGGIPRFADLANDEVQRETAENFGAQWLEFDHVEQHHEQQFLDWIAPVTADFVRSKAVVEGGCGKGRHTRLIGEWGARDVVGVDLSVAVEAAYRNTRDLPNVHIIQADIYRLPLKAAFDYAFSVGVLHHLPDPRAGFASLVKHVKPGGAISAWVYGFENNEWIVNFVNPLREHVTSKLPMRALYFLSYLPTLLLWLPLKLIYLPLGKTALKRFLFYADYLCYIASFPFREIHNIVHDHLTAPVAFYISRPEFEDWFRQARTERAEIHWHNSNSWRGFAVVQTKAEASYGK